MHHSIRAQFVILLLTVSVGFAMTPQIAEAQQRPTPMGVWGANSSVNFEPNIGECFTEAGTLGAVVADQDGTQYILSVAHFLAIGPSGYFATGSPQPITQPDVVQVVAHCNDINPAVITSLQVATLSTVVPVSFTGLNQADAAIARVLPGKVSSSIVGIPKFSGTALKVVKAGLIVQQTGAVSGNKTGKVISKVLMPARYKVCRHIPTTPGQTVNGCGFAVIRVNNTFEVGPGRFGRAGDSGALVLTTGPCPQPVGVLLGGADAAGTAVLVESIGSTLQALQSAGGYSSLSIVPGGGGCNQSVAQIQLPDGSTTLEDPTVADPDVAQALAVLPDLSSAPLIYVGMLEGSIDGIGIDLSVSPAALDVVVDSSADLDPYHVAIPATFEGVTVEQDVIKTFNDSGDVSEGLSASY